ncbi:MAG TPA: proprotein convertase P-domain-containing protein, partial [Terriglobales bacterium]|nr:proprotein convertase P-domain-containing protein [Terriglobales bacterium]
DKSTFPLLNAGRYVVRLCNLGSDDAVAALNASLWVNPTGPSHTIASSTNFVPLIAAGLTTATNCITNTAPIVSANVGLRIDDPQISDLAVTLISPQGTRVLLQQNRGGTNTAGLGASVLMTNVVPVSSSGGADANTNTVNTGQRAGTVTIDYNFYALPDDMHIYYDGNLIYDSGEVSFTGHTNIHYGPGSGTSVTIIMNEAGNPDTNTLWDYTVTSTQPGFQYATFTDDTNLTTTPIKFAIPPLNTPGVAANGRDYGIFYLPEESLARLAGENPQGIWRLEMADDGVGIPEIQPALLGWRLDFVLADTTPTPLVIPYGQALMRVLCPNQTQLFAVDVPSWAHLATNTLLSASAPVNLVFNQHSAPGFPPASADQIMLAGTTNGQFILSSTNGSPLLLPATRFFLAVQNTNQTSVSFSFQEDFDVPPPPPLLIGTINVSSAGAQLQWTAAPGLSFQVQWSPSLSPPSWTTFFDVLTSGNGSYSYLDDGSQTGGLDPVRFYRVVQLP